LSGDIARLLAASEADEHAGTPRREVPEIRLSGLWLERVGFPKGTRYLMSADRSFATIYLQADIPKADPEAAMTFGPQGAVSPREPHRPRYGTTSLFARFSVGRPTLATTAA